MARPPNKKASAPRKSALPAALILAAALGAAAAWYLLRPRPQEPGPEALLESVASLLADRTEESLSRPPLDNTGTILYKRRSEGGGYYYSLAWRGGSGTQVIIAEKAIEDLWRGLGRDLAMTITYPDHSEEGEKVRLSASMSGAGLVQVKLFAPSEAERDGLSPPGINTRQPGHSGKIAIIVDDIGNDLESLAQLLEIEQPLTFSVLPNAEFTDQSCRMLRRAGAQVMLHMPMEPVSYPQTDPGSGALLLSMDKAAIQDAVREALSRVPCAKGMNNHMGSAFTADPRAMAAVMEVLASRGLFFIDSRTTAQTAAYSTALESGVPSAERKVFLDHDPSLRAVRASLLDLALEAEANGFAIGIGHPYPQTIEVLRETLPKLSAMGYHFVPAGELAR